MNDEYILQIKTGNKKIKNGTERKNTASGVTKNCEQKRFTKENK